MPRYALKCSTALLAILSIAWGSAARADDDFIVYSPYVTAGQSELELRGHQQYDGDPALDGERSYLFSAAHAFTSWWHPEIYVATYEREPGGPNRLQGYEFENIFQLTDQGQYWADFGFIASYVYNKQPGVPGVVEFGPLIEKKSGRVDQRLNFIWEKQFGSGAEGQYHLRGTYAASYSFSQAFAPGFEAYDRPADDSRQLGPALTGEVDMESGNEFEYSLAWLLGLNRGAPDRVLALRLEFEFNQ